jgi:hypothetical protein
MCTEFRFGNVNGKCHSKDLSVDGRIILKWVLRKYGGRV